MTGARESSGNAAYRGRVSVVTEHLKAAFRPADLPSRRRPAAKVAIIQLIVLGGLTLLGHFDLATLTTLGLFAVLYAPSAAYKRRLTVVSAIAVAMVLCVLVGIAAGPNPVALLVVVVLFSMAAVFLCLALQVGPPAAYFLMLGCGVVNFMVYKHDIPPERILVMTMVGGIAAVVGTMAELIPAPYGPERKAVTAAVAATRAYADSAPGDGSRPMHRRGAEALHRARTELSDAYPLFPRAPWAARRMASVRSLEAELGAAERAFGARVGKAAERILAVERDETSVEAGRDSDSGLTERLEGVARASGGRPSVPTLLRQAAAWPSDQLVTTARVGVAAGLAGLVTVLIGGDHIYWSTAFAAVALHQGGARIVQSYRAVNRLVGTVFGVVLFALIAAIQPSGIVLILVMIVLQFFIELVVAKQYALATFLITPLALIISVGGALPDSPWSILSERLLDTVIGVASAFIAVWFFGRGLPRSVLRGQTERTLRSMSDYLAVPGGAGGEPADIAHRRERLALDARELETVASALTTERGGGDSRGVRSAREVAEVAYVLLGAESWRPGGELAANSPLPDSMWRKEGIDGVRATLDEAAREIATDDIDAAGARIDGLVTELAQAVRRE